ncbi:siroheme synthase CysG [Aurantivibrio plasticivorans]
MEYLPIFVDIKRHPSLIIGGGDVALRKAQSLTISQGVVHVVSPKIEPELEQLLKDNKGKHIQREFHDSDIEGYRLVIAATDDHETNAHIAQLAEKTGCLFNAVDEPAISNFISPAVIDRNPIVVAISSTGKAPVLARAMREKIEAWFPANYGALAGLAGNFRDQVKQKITSGAQRLRFWETIFNGPAGERALAGNIDEAKTIIQQTIDNNDETLQGEVFLVGAGPGDPDLLTLKALRLMQLADVVLYDRLVSDDIMTLVRKDAERIYVGKQRAEHTMQQVDINQRLVDLAKQGKRVLRLKGGDPFIFGRGGEELELLAENHVPFQVVPGITAASGCASYAGIPLTHRDHAQSVRFITGHLKSDAANTMFEDVKDPNQTLVFYMGLVALADICKRLIEIGRSPLTPAALIEKGTTTQQRVFIGNLETLRDLVEEHQVSAPTLVIIGDVVGLHDQLNWFRVNQQFLKED